MLKVSRDKNPVPVAKIHTPNFTMGSIFFQIAQHSLQSGYPAAVIAAAEINLDSTSECEETESTASVPGDFGDKPPGKLTLTVAVEILDKCGELPGQNVAKPKDARINPADNRQTGIFRGDSAGETYTLPVHQVKVMGTDQSQGLSFLDLYEDSIWNLPGDYGCKNPGMTGYFTMYRFEIQGEDIGARRNTGMLDQDLWVQLLRSAYVDSGYLKER